jgi:hypothetical protein
MLNKVKLYLRKSFIGRTFFKYKRSIRTDKKLVKSKGTKVYKYKFLNKLSFFKRVVTFKIFKTEYKKRFRVVFVVLTTAIVIFILSSIFIKYNKIKPVEYSKLIDTDLKIYPSDNIELNTIFLIYDTKSIDGIEYNFIQHISLVSINNQTHIQNTLIINPYFQVFNDNEDSFSIYSLLNNLSSKNKFSEFKNSLEELLGLRVDRYIAVENGQIINFLTQKDFSYDSQNISDEINEENISSYVFDINPSGINTYLIAQREFLENLFAHEFGRWDKLKYFIDSNNLLSSFQTNMSKKELSFFINNVDLDGNFEYLNSDLGVYSEVSDFIMPNNVLLDEKIKKVFNSIPIRAEQAELEVYNGSNIKGIASKKNREFKNLGVNIVKYGNYIKILDKNTLIIKDQLDFDKYKYTIAMIKRSLYGNLEVQIGQSDVNSTGDLILILGENN